MKKITSYLKAIMLMMAITFITKTVTAQNIEIGTTTPDASLLLDIKSTTKDLLEPRMSNTQRNAIASPAIDLMFYQTDATPGLNQGRSISVKWYSCYNDTVLNGSLNGSYLKPVFQDIVSLPHRNSDTYT